MAGQLRVSVSRSEVAVWAIIGGHAYAFAKAEDARFLLDHPEMVSHFTPGDAVYDVLCWDPSVRWDATPPALSEVA